MQGFEIHTKGAATQSLNFSELSLKVKLSETLVTVITEAGSHQGHSNVTVRTATWRLRGSTCSHTHTV